MYKLNELDRKVLITVDEVIFHAPTKHSLDPRMILQSIIVAEERFIRPEIGSAMYDYIVEQKNIIVTSGNIAALEVVSGLTLQEGQILNAVEQLNPSYQSLWKNHMWKLTSECVIASSYPEGFAQFGSEGVIHQSPPAGLMVTSGLVTPLLGTVKWAMDKKIQDRIAPLFDSMHEYICKNKVTNGYSLYRKTCPEIDCNGDIEVKEKWAGLALDMYDDD